jgi:hypothetical protein
MREAASWCRARAEELKADILSVPIPFAELPLGNKYGAVCKQVRVYALALGAPFLTPEPSAITMEGCASMTETLRQVQALANWLAVAQAATGSQAGEDLGGGPLPPPNDPPEQTDVVARAIALMLTWEKQERKYKVEELARAVGTSKATLYRDDRFQAARKAARALGNRPPQGHKDAEGELEAYAPEDED